MRLFRRPSEKSDDEEIFELAISDFLEKLHTCIPGRIAKYDAATQKANVQPVIFDHYWDPDEEVIVAEKFPIIPCVPIIWPSSNDGASITFPLKKGDPVFLFFSERSVAEYLLIGNKDNAPASARAFDLSDGFAIPGGRSFNHSSGHAAPIPTEGLDERAVVVRGPEVHVRSQDSVRIVTNNATLVIEPDGTLVYDGPQVKLGAGASEFLARADRVEARLQAIETVVNTQSYNYLAPAIPAGPAATGPSPIQVTPATQSGDTASNIIKGE